MGLEDPAIKQLESAYVGMDSLGLCKCTKKKVLNRSREY